MKGSILIQIGITSAAAFGLALLFSFGERFSKDGFDERQMVERGKGAQIAMITAMGYLIALWAGAEFELLDAEYTVFMAVWGLVLTMVVFNGYCVFHDAHLKHDQSPAAEIVMSLVLGGLWFGMGVFRVSYGSEISLVQLAISFEYVSLGVMLLLRMLYVRIRDRMEDGADANG